MAEETFRARALDETADNGGPLEDPLADPLADFQEKPDDAEDRAVENFCSQVAKYLHQQLLDCESLREKENFSEWKERIDRRADMAPDVRIKADGTLDTDNSKDRHLPLGLMHGMTRQAIASCSAQMYRTIFESSQRFFNFKGLGQKKENRILADAFTAFLDTMFRRGRFKELCSRAVSASTPRYGTAFLRYYPTAPQAMKRGPDGAYHETRQSFRPYFHPWPFEDVYVTDPGKFTATEQEGVFFVSRGVTLRALEPNEATFDHVIGGDSQTPRRRTKGIYFNLDKIRSQEFETIQSAPTENRASLLPSYKMIEYEGALPMAYFTRSGDFSPAVAARLGINVGQNEDPEMSLAEFASRLNSITHWFVSWVEEDDGISNLPSGTKTLTIRFEPCPFFPARNTLYVMGYQADGESFYRKGVGHLGAFLEDSADMLLNYYVITQRMNSHPPIAVNVNGLVNKTLGEVERIYNTPGGMMKLAAGNGMGVEQIVQQMFRKVDENLPNVIRQLKSEHTDTVGVIGGALSGDAGIETGTLGEIRLNESKANSIQSDAILGMAAELCRMAKDVLRDAATLLTPDEFFGLMREACGTKAAKIEQYLTANDLEKIDEILEMTHPMTISLDYAVVFSNLINLWQAFKPQNMNTKVTLKTALQLLQIPNEEDFEVQATDPLTPEEEHKQLGAGNWLDPTPQDNMQAHLSAHYQMKQQVDQAIMLAGQLVAADDVRGFDQAVDTMAAQLGLSGHALNNLAEQLPNHIKASEDLYQMLLRMQAMQAAQAAGMDPGQAQTATGGAAAPEQPPGGPGMAQTPPAAAGDQQQGIETAAHRGNGQAMQNAVGTRQ